MKNLIVKVFTIVLAVMCATACANGTSNDRKSDNETVSAQKGKSLNQKRKSRPKKKKRVFSPTSAGGPYEIMVVSGEETERSGSVDTLCNILTDDLPGVFQSEPLFTVSRVNKSILKTNLRICRNMVIIKIDPSYYSTCKMSYEEDVYAEPQLILNIQAPNTSMFNEYVKEHADEIIRFFDRSELNREAEILKESHNDVINKEIMRIFGCRAWVPKELDKMTTGRDFLWARHEGVINGVEQIMNFVMYSYPYTDVNTFTEEYFVHKRDSVLKKYIPGPREDQYMTTYADLITSRDETVHGAYAQVVRGHWQMHNYDMGGPFISMVRVDEENNRIIVTEGFVYYPNKPKRNILKKMEACLYTISLPGELELENNSFNLDEIVITPQD